MTPPRVINAPANPRVVGVLRAAAQTFAIIIVVVPALVLVGWEVDITRFKSVIPGLIAMNPVTAVAFILCGIALWTEIGPENLRKKLVIVIGATVAIIGAIKLFGVLMNLPTGLDQLLFRHRLDAEPIPNRMAPNTALGFVLSGTSLLLSRTKEHRGPLPSQILALALAWLALLALVGYAYRASRLYDVGAYIPMGLHTAMLFLLVSLAILFIHAHVGLMAVVTSDSPAGALARRLLPFAVFAPILLGWLWLGGTRRRWLPAGLEFPLVILANTMIFTALLWWELALLRRADALRSRAEIELQWKNRVLEETAHSQREAHEALKQAQSQLVQSEKLAGLGQMVAGVAHEINNPLAFVANNVAVVQRDLRGLIELVSLLQKLLDAPEQDRAALRSQIMELTERLDLTYSLSNLPDVLTRSREGLRRIQQIVKDLRDFARLDESAVQEADLNAGITSTINIIAGHAKKKAVRIETALASLPPVRCHPAKINQVVMNLLSNAIDASKDEGTVRVETRVDREVVCIVVRDSGCGIDPSIRERIFDPFFTTKPPGHGTGLGLSISYGIVQDHGGKLEVDSTPGSGSCFTVRLPLTAQHGA